MIHQNIVYGGDLVTRFHTDGNNYYSTKDNMGF
jgi:hypothetical protein